MADSLTMHTIHYVMILMGTIIGLLGGMTTAHFLILKKLNAFDAQNAKHTSEIETLFHMAERIERSHEQFIELQRTSMNLIQKVIDQNNILIHRLSA